MESVAGDHGGRPKRFRGDLLSGVHPELVGLDPGKAGQAQVHREIVISAEDHLFVRGVDWRRSNKLCKAVRVN